MLTSASHHGVLMELTLSAIVCRTKTVKTSTLETSLKKFIAAISQIQENMMESGIKMKRDMDEKAEVEEL